MLDWQKLLSDYRIGKDGNGPGPAESGWSRSSFESDYDRVLYSAAFRRMARKTQVHPNVTNDHVHNRLTHSLEVASAGRTLARRLGLLLEERKLMPKGRTPEDIAWIIQTACLAHDIGNPPFGHAGEFAIREWTKTNKQDMFGGSQALNQDIQLDWERFEGNAQSFRLCARSDNLNSIAYIRMTFSSLGALVKYPWCSTSTQCENTKKCNFFSTEQDIFRTVWEELGLDGGSTFLRHPLSYLMEAADDLCYKILDVEDAVAMKIIRKNDARELFAKVAQADHNGRTLQELRGAAIGCLLKQSWHVFEDSFDQINRGETIDPLFKNLPDASLDAINEIKSHSEDIFGERSKVATELGAYKVLGKIIKAISHAVIELASTNCFDKVSFIRSRCLELTWGSETVRQHETKALEWWLAQTRDYVAGLTDNYAQQLAREIEGV